MRNTHMSTPSAKHTRVVQSQRTAPRPLVPTTPPTAQLHCTPSAVYAARAQLHAYQAQQRAIAQACSSWFSWCHVIARNTAAFQQATAKGDRNMAIGSTPQWAAYVAQCNAIRANTSQSVAAQQAALKAAKAQLKAALAKAGL